VALTSDRAYGFRLAHEGTVPMLRTIVCLACVVATELTLGGCSPSSGRGSPSGQGARSIGSGGGSVTTPDGSGVTIPPGALPAGPSVDITAAIDPNGPAPPPSPWVAVGPTYLFGPEGQQFLQPVTVTLVLDPASFPPDKTASDISILTSPSTGTPSYTALATTVLDATHVSAQTTHFSDFVAALQLAPAEEDGGVDAESDASGTGSPDGSAADATLTPDAADAGATDAPSDAGLDSLGVDGSPDGSAADATLAPDAADAGVTDGPSDGSLDALETDEAFDAGADDANDANDADDAE
jgi:ZU5 domain